MARYLVRPTRTILVEGQTVTPEDVIASIESDLSARTVLDMLQFRQAGFAKAKSRRDSAGGDSPTPSTAVTSDSDSDSPNSDVPESPFAGYSAKVQSILAAEGITTLAHAALYARDHDGSLIAINGIGPKLNEELLAQIVLAGLPIK